MEPSTKSAFAYDQVPYPGSADAATHPRRLEAVATLLGIQPADIRGCRILELGCASGRALLAMAQEFPDSRFVGVDLSGDRIHEASLLAETLGLENIEFRHASLTEVDESWGQFDYIICLGVLTWVAPEIREHIFEILRVNLRPRGIGVVSYNVFPGWHQRNAMRDAMRYFAGPTDDPGKQIQRARKVLEFIAETTPDNLPHGQAYRESRDYLRRTFDDYLYHDFLTGDNRPIYFHEFHGGLEQHGLMYVGEADYFARNSLDFGAPTARSVLQQLSFVERCQMLDFLRNESYRKSLVCHPGMTVDFEALRLA